MLNALFLSIPSSTSTNVTYPATNACILYVQRSSGRTTHDLSLVLIQESSTSHEERVWSMKYSPLKYVSRMGRWLHDRNEIQRQRWRLTWSNRNGIFVSWHRWLYGDGRTTITDPAIGKLPIRQQEQDFFELFGDWFNAKRSPSVWSCEPFPFISWSFWRIWKTRDVVDLLIDWNQCLSEWFLT